MGCLRDIHGYERVSDGQWCEECWAVIPPEKIATHLHESLPPSAGPTDLDAICPKCGYREGQHLRFEHTCPIWEDWYCWTCAGIGYFPGEWDWDPEDRECPCCSKHDHESDASLPPPCHSEAREMAILSGEYQPGWTKWDWERAKAIVETARGARTVS